MIRYKLKETEIEIDFKKFVSLDANIKYYKSDFKDLSNLVKFLDKNIKNISIVLFDGIKYIIEDGGLHNLYGPAKIIWYSDEELTEKPFSNPYSFFYFINDKRVHNKPDARGCRNDKDFSSEIFHINLKKPNLEIEKIPINLKNLILKDKRKRKLNKLEDGY